MKPTFSEEEVDRVARRLGMEGQQFIETYLERSEGGQRESLSNPRDPLPFPER
jgi:hypothetical protein